jgi:RecB family exonuclease
MSNTVHVNEDRVPVVAADELVSGGATTIQRQLNDPISAFVAGRLSVRSLQSISNGLSASLRGNLIHDALDYLYGDLPSQSEIAAWQDDERQNRIDNAVRSAFARHERFVDPVLQELLLLERRRAHKLLQGLVAVDIGRESFAIARVEQAIDVALSGIRLKLRIDRQDRLDDDSLIILDYKTGVKKRFLDGQREPLQIQLVVYACAVNQEVAGLGLINIDSRSIDLDGAGRSFTSTDSWDEDLLRWKSRVKDAAAQIQRGDVRINMVQGSDAARPLSLLSRVEELRHDR